MTAHPDINDLFGLLDKWRHFAGFPLEARSEILFALFLPTVLQHHFKMGINPHIIPQFPLKHDDSNQSNNVDFFALSEDGKKGFLIELKTDMGSIEKKQICYLRRAKFRGMREILEDLRTIAKVKRIEPARKKYYHLLSALAELDLIKLQDALCGKMYSNDPTGVYEEIKCTEILASPTLEVVYVQPRKSTCEDKQPLAEGFKFIYFDEFANCIESQGNMGGLFAGYLRKWKEDPANQPPCKA